MSIFNKTRYLRSIFILIPVGIMLLYFGYEGVTKKIEDFPYHKGVVQDYKLGQKYFKDCECRTKTFFIYIKQKDFPYITTIQNHIEILKSNINESDSIEIWTWDKTNYNEIEQVKLNGKLIIPYKKTIGLYVAFLIIGIGLLILCVFYILNSSEDFFGKKNYDEEES